MLCRTSSEEVQAGDSKAWRQGPDGWQWQAGGRTVARVVLHTSRERREDLSGMRQFVLVTRQEVVITVHIGAQTVTLEALQMRGGEKAVLREILTWGEGWLYMQVAMQLKDQARQSGVAEWDILTAETQAGSSARLLEQDYNYWRAVKLLELLTRGEA